MSDKNQQSGYTLISLAELGKILGISRIAVYKKVKKGQIAAKRVGRSYAVSTDFLKEKAPDLEIEQVSTQKEYISIPQLAKILGLSRVTVHNRVRDGIIKAGRVGRSFVIPLDEVERLKAEMPLKPARIFEEKDMQRFTKDVCARYKRSLEKLTDEWGTQE